MATVQVQDILCLGASLSCLPNVNDVHTVYFARAIEKEEEDAREYSDIYTNAN